MDERLSFKFHKENAGCGDSLHKAVTNPDHNLYGLLENKPEKTESVLSRDHRK